MPQFYINFHLAAHGRAAPRSIQVLVASFKQLAYIMVERHWAQKMSFNSLYAYTGYTVFQGTSCEGMPKTVNGNILLNAGLCHGFVEYVLVQGAAAQSSINTGRLPVEMP
jgi:hypothetical protein